MNKFSITPSTDPNKYIEPITGYLNSFLQGGTNFNRIPSIENFDTYLYTYFTEAGAIIQQAGSAE